MHSLHYPHRLREIFGSNNYSLSSVSDRLLLHKSLAAKVRSKAKPDPQSEQQNTEKRKASESSTSVVKRARTSGYKGRDKDEEDSSDDFQASVETGKLAFYTWSQPALIFLVKLLPLLLNLRSISRLTRGGQFWLRRSMSDKWTFFFSALASNETL